MFWTVSEESRLFDFVFQTGKLNTGSFSILHAGTTEENQEDGKGGAAGRLRGDLSPEGRGGRGQRLPRGHQGRPPARGGQAQVVLLPHVKIIWRRRQNGEKRKKMRVDLSK